MNAVEMLKALQSKPVFGVKDVQRIGTCSRKYAIEILGRMKARGLIKKISENAYTTKDDINVIASNMIYPCYISFWYASYYLGYTEQIVNTVQVSTTVRKKRIEFENYEIKFIPLKHFFGYRKIRTSEGDIFIAEDEKLLIDAFLRPEECGNFDEIEKIFENAKISREKIVEYLKAVGSMTVIKRVGFLLESKKSMDLSGEFELDKNYAMLNPFSRTQGNVNAKWRLKV